jgi:type II secretory pathway pseudopilin PulG
MMIVVLIIGTVATILLPNYRRSVLKAQATDVLGKVEAINVALKDYESDHQSPPDGVGPAGAPPAWLVPYAPARWFTGPSGVTLQLSIAGPTAPTLVIAANSTDNQQILLAAAGVLGQRATVLGGGAQVTVTLTH